MLTFYYHPLSPIARRVWIALLEKEIEFEPVVVDLRGKQFEADFLAINPFHHVPAIAHEGLTVIESLAILDYLELRFAQRSLMPTGAAEMARMRMVQMVVMNELIPKLVAYAIADEETPLSPSVIQQVDTGLSFLAQQLGDKEFFGGAQLSLADIVAGATVPLFARLGCGLQPHGSLERWHQGITQRPAWQQTSPTEDQLIIWQRWLKLQVKRKQRANKR